MKYYAIMWSSKWINEAGSYWWWLFSCKLLPMAGIYNNYVIYKALFYTEMYITTSLLPRCCWDQISRNLCYTVHTSNFKRHHIIDIAFMVSICLGWARVIRGAEWRVGGGRGRELGWLEVRGRWSSLGEKWGWHANNNIFLHTLK